MLSDDDSEYTKTYRNGINMTFLLLAGINIYVCFLNLIFWMVKKARDDVYEYLLTAAYEDFVSPSNKSKKKISLEDLQNSAGGSSFLTIFKIPAFWGRLAMMICSLCILLISPLFSVLFVFSAASSRLRRIREMRVGEGEAAVWLIAAAVP